MQKLKIGDRIYVNDGSYSFGIKNGQYSRLIGDRNNVPRQQYIIIKTGLRAMRDINKINSGEYTTVCDILITDGDGDFFFTQEKFVKLVEFEHIVVFNGDEPITISHKSYQELKKHFS